MPEVKVIAMIAIGLLVLVAILTPFVFVMVHPAIGIVLVAAVIGGAVYVIRRKRRRNLV